MKRIFLTALGIGLLLANIKAQELIDSTTYKSRKLKMDEINFVSSYYAQNGDHAAVTGGTGSQQLHDIANVIEVKFIRYAHHLNKQGVEAALGIDYYTSASSDKIDLLANSSASHSDARIYPSLNFSNENETKGTELVAGISTSSESDYESKGANLSYSKKTKDKNGEFIIKCQAYLDNVSIIKPIELRTSAYRDYHHYLKKPRNTYSLSLSYSQVINERLQVMLLADVVQQHGYLGLPFYRVYFKDASVHIENLPVNRFKIPLGVRINYFSGDKIIIRTYYRFYYDDWGLTAHTASIELPVKITPFTSLSPFYRFYSQNDAKYFAPFQSHTASEEYYTSNYDLAKFNSNFFGVGIKFTPIKGISGKPYFNTLELRYGHYIKNVQLNSDVISLNLKFK